MADLIDNLYWYKANFVRAIDGDTIEVEVDHGMKIYSHCHIRLKGINACEIFGVQKDSQARSVRTWRSETRRRSRPGRAGVK